MNKRVIDCIVGMAGIHGVCLLDMETIMKETGLSRNRVYAKLSEMVEKRDIAIFRQNGLDYISIQNKAVMG
jgi:hypothetical protein